MWNTVDNKFTQNLEWVASVPVNHGQPKFLWHTYTPVTVDCFAVRTPKIASGVLEQLI